MAGFPVSWGPVNKSVWGQWGRKSLLPAMTLVAGGVAGAIIASFFIDPQPTSPTLADQAENKLATVSPAETAPPAKPDQAGLVLASFKDSSNVNDFLPALPALKSEPALPEPVSKTVSVSKGDTLMKVLTRAGADRQESHEAVKALTKVFNPRSLKIGQDIFLTFEYGEDTTETSNDRTPRLMEVALKEDVDRQVAALRSEGGDFTPRETVLELKKEMVRAGGVITNSLFLSAAKAGVPTKTIIDMIRIFSYDVDFQREIQPGDSFEIFFERYLDERQRAVKEGNIFWASMTLSGEKLSLYRFKTTDDGFTDYYTAKGHSTKKTLMRTPIDGARLTSGFGKRRHPILGYTKMHRGADFGAPRGTPIMAAGKGVIEYAGRNGAYGKYVRIRHNSDFKTAYAHMKGFAKGIHKGKRVRQGQIIGYVGSTGRSTGPHLHYEVLKHGRQINPHSVKLPAGRKLGGKMLSAFQKHMKSVNTDIANAPLKTQLARLQQ